MQSSLCQNSSQFILNASTINNKHNFKVLFNSGMDRLRLLFARFRTNILNPFKSYLSTPIAKITVANSILFTLWQTHDVSSTFLAKHFAFERENLNQNRIHTFLTYSFSHMSFLHFAINIIALNMIGMKIKVSYGSKYVWALCMMGALAGGITMQYLMPYDSIPIPKVGADPCISAFISFLATMSPTKVAFKFVFPFQYWFILLAAIGIVVATDSSGRNLGGLAAGVGLGLLRRRLLL